MDDHAGDRKGREAAFTIQPVGAAQHGPPPNVNFKGVVTPNSPTYDTAVPSAYRCHPLLQDRFFYTVPEQLLQTVCRPQTGERFEFDEDLFQMELDLARISGDHGSRVGFWNNEPLQCWVLHANPLTREELARLDLTEDQIAEMLGAVNETLLSFSDIARSYAGWLMTNPAFLAEFSAVAEEFGQQMRCWGTSQAGLPIPASQPAGRFNPTSEEGWAEYDAAVVQFCTRWRLLGLAGPRIPVPMRPMMAGQFPLSVVAQLMRAGGVFNWPDTFPLFARDQLRDLLDGALQSSGDSDYLAGWRDIISSKNKAKNRLATYKRIFRFQHFWRVLRERHPRAFHRRLDRAEQAFSDYFGVGIASIKLDRKLIKSRLGADWDQVVDPFNPPR